MELDEAFRNYEDKIVRAWVDYTLSSYKSSTFFKKERDKFANPVGGNTFEALSKLFKLLTKNADPKEFVAPLDQVMRIRSIQEFSASEAVGPIHAVKHITREILEKDKERKHLIAELYDFEFAVDLAVLAAFDLYMQCREQLYKVRILEIKSGTHILTDSKCPSSMLKKDIDDLVKIHI
ncbi:MAG: RsbRD N-terminal domain-containing protein [Proteobacteria bacterium]|nr:RsbRD N-terminal domain-containing protein [Pseudomonadota bacterium]MBU1059037.1 RsbRD N-terminal domain-containing protein [Pseudomonadota bacterium]